MVKILITILFLILTILHIAFPDIKIDSITIVLLFFSLLPWIIHIIKTIEIPGVGKIEINDLNKVKEKVEKSEKFTKVALNLNNVQLYETLIENDPNLALAGLRIEIEKKLIKLAESNNISVNKKGLKSIIIELKKKDIFNQNESAAIADLLGILNRAVHGAEVDQNTAFWAIDLGSNILSSLDYYIGN
jgi:hypothetical protein